MNVDLRIVERSIAARSLQIEKTMNEANPELADFSANLRLSCSHHRSIAEVCRRLDLNRPQFNRYLAGQSRPAAHTLRKLGDFFGFEVFEWWLPHSDFAQLLKTKPQAAPSVKEADAAPPPAFPRHLRQLANLGSKVAPAMARYLGVYYEYYWSMSYPDRVLRSLVCMVRARPADAADGAGVRYVRWERLAPPGTDRSVERCRYEGSAYMLNERIFMLDIESFTENELTQTICFPSYRSRVTRLSGLKIGVSASEPRHPCSTRVLLEFLGPRVDLRHALSQCGLIEPYVESVGSINPEILRLIDNREPGSAQHFVALPHK